MLIEPKTDQPEAPTFKWVVGITLPILIALGGYAFSDLKSTVTSQGARIQAFELRENNLQNSLNNVMERQKSEHALLVKIAGKLGIEVAE